MRAKKRNAVRGAFLALAVVLCPGPGGPRAGPAGLSGPSRAEEPPLLPAQDPFAGEQVVDLGLEISTASLAELRDDPRRYVRAVLRAGGAVLGEVGVRVKGSAGSFRPADSEKPGFTVKVNHFAPQGRFHGRRKFLLNNAAQDPSYFSELLGNELFRAAGVPAVQAGFARLEVNGRDLGLYVLIEAVTRDFLARHFESPHGNLYEGPGDVSGEIDSDASGPFLEREDLRMLSNAAEEPDPRERMRRLREVLDLDRFASFLAMEAMMWHWDGYGVGVNNYRIYDDPTAGRMVFLPHGSDQLFQEPDGPLAPELQGLVGRAVLTTAAGQRLYRERVEALLASVLDEAAVRRRVEALAAVIRPVLARRSKEEAKEHEGAVEDLLERISRRIRSVREQLAGGTGLFGAPLEFDEHGKARLSGWKPRSDRGEPELEEEDLGRAGAEERGEREERETGSPQRVLRIGARAEASCVGSWRTRVLLRPGRYRLAGLLETRGVTPLDGEEGEGAYPSGACLRISGHHPARKLLGSSGWRQFTFDFTVDRNGALHGEAGGESGKVDSGGDGDGGDRESGSEGSRADEEPGGESAEAPAIHAVQLVCELRAGAGEVRFDADSLQLARR